MKKLIAIVMSLLFVSTSCINSYAQESIDNVPIQYIVWALEMQDEFEVDAFLLVSLCYTESRFDESVVGGNVSQVTNLKWFKKGIKELGLDNPKGNPRQNMRLCGYYLKEFFEEHPDETYLVLDCWNKGQESAELSYNPNRPSYYSKEIAKRAEEWSEEWYTAQSRIKF